MRSHHDWEAYLDSLDRRFYLQGSKIRVEFSNPFSIDIQQCCSLDHILIATRDLTIRLMNERPSVSVYPPYLVKRFIRLVSKFHGIKVDLEKVAHSIGLAYMEAKNYTRKKDQNTVLQSLRFDDDPDKYSQTRHVGFEKFVELERLDEHKLRVTHNCANSDNHKQHATVSRFDVSEIDSGLLLFLPESLTWQFEYPSPTKNINQDLTYGTRIVLFHSFNEDLQATIRSDMQSLMEGLPFEYSCRKPA